MFIRKQMQRCLQPAMLQTNLVVAQQLRMFAVAAKRSEFFDFPATLIDGTKIEKLDDIVGDKKAILVVNVASE